ncbi:YciI family protein [Winogradskyella sp.]|uniref:YciI family protein n=1 Tax=Winogradskyella sp. TaxID=1883156 RepID=UPI00351494EC
MRNLLFIMMILTFVLACKSTKTHNEKQVSDKKLSVAEMKAKLTAKGFQIFDYVDEKTQDTVLMQQYFIAFLKRGPARSQDKEETARLQKAHLAHLGKMYELGYADISGPFGDDGEIRGITIYNVPNIEMADSLANADPMVKAGRLVIEVHPWWAAKGFPLR